MGTLPGFDDVAESLFKELTEGETVVDSDIFYERLVQRLGCQDESQHVFIQQLCHFVLPTVTFDRQELQFWPRFKPKISSENFVSLMRNFGPIDSFFQKCPRSLFPNDSLVAHYFHNIIDDDPKGEAVHDALKNNGDYYLLLDSKTKKIACMVNINKTVEKRIICNSPEGFCFEPCRQDSKRYETYEELFASERGVFITARNLPREVLIWIENTDPNFGDEEEDDDVYEDSYYAI